MSHQRTSLSYRARREVLAQMASRYQEATDAQKTLLLDQVVELTCYGCKYAITLLNHVPESKNCILRPRQPLYGPAVQEALFLAWRAIHYPCAQRLVPFYRACFRSWSETSTSISVKSTAANCWR